MPISIRDSKLSRKVDDKHHVEIALQLQLYGWLFEQTVGKPAKRLQVHAGGGDIIEVPFDGGAAALAELAHIVEVKRLGAEPYEPLGWTKCSGGCGYYDRCWKQAEERQDVSLVMDVDQGLARALNGIGVTSAQQLLASFDVKRLSEFKRPWGKGEQKVGKKAEKILMYADVLCSGKERILSPADIPVHDNYVMFDLEGMPPYLDELEKIYLWGMQVYGKRPSEFVGVTAGFGANGDREGWEAFLNAAKKLFDDYGDIPLSTGTTTRRPTSTSTSRATETRTASPLVCLPTSSTSCRLPRTRLPFPCQATVSRSSRIMSDSSGRRTSTAEAGRWRSSSLQLRPRMKASVINGWAKSSSTTRKTSRRRGLFSSGFGLNRPLLRFLLPRFSGSPSLKVVLPAFEPQMTYLNMGCREWAGRRSRLGIARGGGLDQVEREKTRKALLEYCGQIRWRW